MRTIITAAIGENYQREAARLTATYPETVVIGDDSPFAVSEYADPYWNGFMTKASFGLAIPPDAAGAVFLLDADLVPQGPDPLGQFAVPPDADMAFVPYPGKFYSADPEIAAAMAAGTPRVNSGFLYFKNAAIAREVSAAWRAEYRLRLARILNGERLDPNDEWPLIVALSRVDLTLEPLDLKWNDWIGASEGDLFVHSHLLPDAPAPDPEPLPPTPQQIFEAALAAGCEVDGVTYGIAEKDQLAWTAALTALDNAQALGAFDPSLTPVETVLGPILDIAGRPVPSMSVIAFRQTMLALVQRIGQIRAQHAGGAQ